MSADTAKTLLSFRPIGSFLLRFSSAPPFFALSVNYGNVGHWRITVEKTSQLTIYRIDGRPYKSLYDIVETHSPGNEPLQIKANSAVATLCFLSAPVDKYSESLPAQEFDV
jgi:hypothetical protein